MGAPGDQHDLLPGFGQQSPDHTADRAGAVYDEFHGHTLAQSPRLLAHPPRRGPGRRYLRPDGENRTHSGPAVGRERSRSASVTTQLVASRVCKRYGPTIILDEVELAVEAGEVVALTGENGAGKTTLLRICAGITRADSGRVQVGGRIGYCPQIPGLFELLTADDHLVMFGRASGLSRDESVKRGHAILAEFDFPLHERTVMRDLSGGTRQKLNLAIALLSDPTVLLLDEPYQGFDRGTYVNFWDHCQTWRQQQKSVVVVTHMLAEFGRADRVVELAAHPSRAHHRLRR